jgi:hypothetical protein
MPAPTQPYSVGSVQAPLSRAAHPSQLLQSKIRGKAIGAREVVPIYWRRLIEIGVPIDAAQTIAWAIVRYDAAQIAPTLQQQQLLRQYCRFICRAGLWRSQLLSGH